jgi:hypothetical protein
MKREGKKVSKLLPTYTIWALVTLHLECYTGRPGRPVESTGNTYILTISWHLSHLFKARSYLSKARSYLSKARSYLSHLSKARSYLSHLSKTRSYLSHLSKARSYLSHLSKARSYLSHLSKARSYLSKAACQSTHVEGVFLLIRTPLLASQYLCLCVVLTRALFDLVANRSKSVVQAIQRKRRVANRCTCSVVPPSRKSLADSNRNPGCACSTCTNAVSALEDGNEC